MRERAGGVCRARVVSFDQLATEALQSCGGCAGPQVTPLGRQMILGHLLRRLQPRLGYLQKFRPPGGPGGGDGCDVRRDGAIRTDECRYGGGVIRPGNAPPDAAGTSLRAKLHDLRLVYDAYRAFLGQDRLDPHLRQTAVLALLRDWPLLRGSTVFVDGFPDFSDDERQTLAVLARACRASRSRSPSTPTSPTLQDPHRLPDDMSLFRRTEETYRRSGSPSPRPASR